MPDAHPHQVASGPLTIYECPKCREITADEVPNPGCNYYCRTDLRPVRVFREEAFSVEHREGDDGRGSHPARPSWDRPSSKWRRLVGPWERVR